MTKPLLLIDVDGVLNPHLMPRSVKDRAGFRRHWLTPRHSLAEYAVWLRPDHGSMLLDVAASAGLDLAWCTTWEHDGNRLIAPRVGLPCLPVVEFGFTAFTWKFGPTLDFAEGRPLAWLDDDFDVHAEHRDWFLARRRARGEPTLLVDVDPGVGLTADHLASVAAWVAELPNERTSSDVEVSSTPGR